MKTSRIMLLCLAIAGLSGCALTFGDQNGGDSRGVDQDISSTHDTGPSSGNLDTPMMQ
jgi:hypothetical protein